MNTKKRKIVFGVVIVVVLLAVMFFSQSKSNLVRELRGPVAGVRAVYTCGDKLMVVSGNNEVYTWEWNDLKKWPTVAKLNTELICPMTNNKIVYIPNGKPDTIMITDLHGEKQITKIVLPFGAKCTMIAASADCSHVAVLLTQDGKNKLAFIGQDLKLSNILDLIDKNFDIFQIGISNNGNHITACGKVKNQAWFVVKNTQSKDGYSKGSQAHSKDYQRYDRTTFSPDSSKLFVSEKIRFTQMYNVESTDLDKTFEIPIYETPSNQKQNNSVVKISPDGRLLAVDTEPAGTVYFWDIESGEKISIIGVSSLTVSDLSFSPDGSMFATGCLVKPTIKIFKTPVLE